MTMIKQHWDRLPIGTVLIAPSGARREIVCELFRPEVDEAGAEPYYVTRHTDDIFSFALEIQLSWLSDGRKRWRIAPESFASSNRRDDLAKAGFFSIDDPDHRERRRAEAEELKRRVDAYASLGLDRQAIHDAIARRQAVLDATSGVWPKPSGEYYKRIYALDNAILYAAGVIDHA